MKYLLALLMLLTVFVAGCGDGSAAEGADKPADTSLKPPVGSKTPGQSAGANQPASATQQATALPPGMNRDHP